MNVAVARCDGRGGERHVEGFVETAGRGERTRHPKAGARGIGSERHCVAVRAIGFVEESGRPQRVAIERDAFRVAGRERLECLGFTLGASELGNFQRGANRALTCANGQLRVGGLRRLIEGLQRFLIARFVVQQRGQLQLQIRVGIRGAANDQRASDEQCECDDARANARRSSPTRYTAQRPHGPTLTGTWAPQPTSPICERTARSPE